LRKVYSDMATFQYIAKDASGNETRGQIEAGDRNSAIAAVRAQGLFPTALGEVKRAASTPAAGGSITSSATTTSHVGFVV
jgi:type II secretory pathway component PulF